MPAGGRNSHMTESTSELIAGCLNGNDQSKAMFYIEFNGLVKRAVGRRLYALGVSSLLRAEIEDIANEVFEHIFQDQCRMLGCLCQPTRIHAWLVAVAGNHTVDYLRKLRARGYAHVSACMESVDRYVCTNEEAACSPDSALNRYEQRERLAQAMALLSEQEHLILDLFYVHGLKHAQIAEIAGLNVNTTSARLRRARIKLRRFLEEDSNEAKS